MFHKYHVRFSVFSVSHLLLFGFFGARKEGTQHWSKRGCTTTCASPYSASSNQEAPPNKGGKLLLPLTLLSPSSFWVVVRSLPRCVAPPPFDTNRSQRTCRSFLLPCCHSPSTVRDHENFTATANTVNKGNPATLSSPNTRPSFHGREGPLPHGNSMPLARAPNPRERAPPPRMTNPAQ